MPTDLLLALKIKLLEIIGFTSFHHFISIAYVSIWGIIGSYAIFVTVKESRKQRIKVKSGRKNTENKYTIEFN